MGIRPEHVELGADSRPPAGRCAWRRSRCSAPSGWSTACSATRSSPRASTRRWRTRRSATSSAIQRRAGARALVRRRDRARGVDAPDRGRDIAPCATCSPWPYPRWIAHRGAGKLAPENTLAAFRLGAAHGYRAFECDVKLSADGVPFLLHDATLERTTGGHGPAGGAAVARARRGSTPARWHGRAYAGEPLPSFAAIAAFCLRNDFALNIEIKPTPGRERETGRVVAAAAAALWAAAPMPPLLSSFQPDALDGARETRAAAAARPAARHAARRLARRGAARSAASPSSPTTR